MEVFMTPDTLILIAAKSSPQLARNIFFAFPHIGCKIINHRRYWLERILTHYPEEYEDLRDESNPCEMVKQKYILLWKTRLIIQVFRSESVFDIEPVLSINQLIQESGTYIITISRYSCGDALGSGIYKQDPRRNCFGEEVKDGVRYLTNGVLSTIEWKHSFRKELKVYDRCPLRIQDQMRCFDRSLLNSTKDDISKIRQELKEKLIIGHITSFSGNTYMEDITLQVPVYESNGTIWADENSRFQKAKIERVHGNKVIFIKGKKLLFEAPKVEHVCNCQYCPVKQFGRGLRTK